MALPEAGQDAVTLSRLLRRTIREPGDRHMLSLINGRYFPAAIVQFFALTCGTAQAAAPSVPMFGSYFPSWLLSAGAAALLTVVVRTVFVVTGLEDILRWRSVLYFSLVAGFAGIINLSVF